MDSGRRRYVFVGDRRSRRAIALGVQWEDGRLAARTLYDALRVLGLDPMQQIYLNVHRDGEPLTVDEVALERIRALVAAGEIIVGLGQAVHRTLVREGIGHLQMIHPAARGAIRARRAYQNHVAAALGRRAMIFSPGEKATA
ncbi:MAG: hypothetical protein HY689_01855 [Chloroflexi bacterium]|nr:hypothetical protein [Chloroflexota bacterium]